MARTREAARRNQPKTPTELGICNQPITTKLMAWNLDTHAFIFYWSVVLLVDIEEKSINQRQTKSRRHLAFESRVEKVVAQMNKMPENKDQPLVYVPFISRKQAKEQGLTYYFNGKPCKAGHQAIRNVCDYGCKQRREQRKVERRAAGYGWRAEAAQTW